jgi:dTDP-4-amino-4,6-dideoxygalactose transaminase
MQVHKIDFWKKNFDQKNININLKKNILNRNISEGATVRIFEDKIANFLKCKYVLAVPNGSVALLISLISLKLKKNDEVILPDRSWISALNAINLLGLKAKFVDVENYSPIICCEQLKKVISHKTKVIIAVHMGGRLCDMEKINIMAKKKKIFVIEDAAQSFGCKFTKKKKYAGTFSDIGCFSLSIAKTISSGQGGFVVTNNQSIFKSLKKIKNNGLLDIRNIKNWGNVGLNFKYTDILATLAISDLNRFKYYKKKLINLYKLYLKNLNNRKIKIITVDYKNGEIPQYIEALCNQRNKLQKFLKKIKVESRIFYPSMHRTNNKDKSFNRIFLNSVNFQRNGIYLPSGPNQNLNKISKLIKVLNTF